MKTQDVIALLRTLTDVTDIVGQKITNSKVPTKDARTGEIDVPFVWIQYRNDLGIGVQNPEPGDQPLGKVYDVECVAADMAQADTLRDAVYQVHGFRGTAGDAAIDMLQVRDQEDDYAPRNQSDDDGVFVCSLLLEVIGE